MELVNDRANQACGRAIGTAPQRVADLGGRDAVLEQQRKQNGGISRERIQHRVLLGGVEEYLANGAVRKIANVHPVTVTGVLDVERDRTAPMWQASPGGHRVRLRCWPLEVQDPDVPSAASTASVTADVALLFAPLFEHAAPSGNTVITSFGAMLNRLRALISTIWLSSRTTISLRPSSPALI